MMSRRKNIKIVPSAKPKMKKVTLSKRFVRQRTIDENRTARAVSEDAWAIGAEPRRAYAYTDEHRWGVCG